MASQAAKAAWPPKADQWRGLGEPGGSPSASRAANPFALLDGCLAGGRLLDARVHEADR